MKKRLFFNLILILIIILGTQTIHAQSSQSNTEFWFAVPYTTPMHIGTSKKPNDRPVSIIMATDTKDANVKISLKDSVLIEVLIPKGSTKVYKIDDKPIIETLVADSIAGRVQNKGLHIESDVPITAYYLIDGETSKEAYALKAEKALGKNFIAPMQKYYLANNYQNSAYNQITIVSAEDNNTITIIPTSQVYYAKKNIATPSDSTILDPNLIVDKSSLKTVYSGGYAISVIDIGKSYQVKLNKGQTYVARQYEVSAYTMNPYSNLGGTQISSTKNIAVTVTEDCLKAGNNIDVVGDQIVPIENIGTSYVVIAGYTNVSLTGITREANDYVYIYATEDNIDVYVNGSTTPSATIAKKGDYYVQQVPDNDALYINTSAPTYCYQVSGYANELGTALIPSMYSIGSKRLTFNLQDIQENIAFVVFRTGKGNKFQITDMDGIDKTSTITITAKSVPGTSDWEYAKIDLSKIKKPGQCIIENTESAFALGYFSANAQTASYTILSNFGGFSLGGDTIYACADEYYFDAGYGKSYKWTLPDGSTQTTTNSIFKATQSGKYSVTVNRDGDNISASTYLKLQNFKRVLQTPGVTPIDIPNKFSVQLNPNKYSDNTYRAEYEWNFGNDANIQRANTAEVKDVYWSSLGKKTVYLTIKNLDAGCSIIDTISVIVVKYPDNISDEDCWITPPASDLTIKESASFDGSSIKDKKTSIPNGVHSMSTPLVADLDGDGIPEIIVPITNRANKSRTTDSDGLLIVNAKDNTERVIHVANFYLHGQSIAIADVDKDGKAEIFVEGTDRKIYSYNYDGTSRNITSTTLDKHTIIQIADINNDGIPELIAGNYIFRADNLKLLLHFPFNNEGTAYGNPHGVNSNEYYNMPAIGDIDGDGDLEIVAGNTVYDIYIAPNSNDSIGNKSNPTIVDINGLPTNFKKYWDGATVLVDFDLDGQLDVCVIGNESTNTKNKTKIQFYVWNPITKKVIACAPEIGYVTTATIPYVGDLDGNGYPDFAFATREGDGMISYQYDSIQAGNIKVGGKKPEFAETAGFTMFDFNQDGKSEIIYRGVDKFYIVAGDSLNKNLSDPITMYSGTITEYPVVADVDGDGQAEIILTRSEHDWMSGDYNVTGFVSIYKSGDPVNQPWAPARKVWNQWSYNAVNINEDMTVPQYQISPGTVFAGKNGDYDARPFNGYLQQQTSLSKAGVPLFLTPNAQVVNPNNIQYRYDADGDSLVISGLEVTNIGSAPLNAPVKIAVYKNSVPSTPKYVYNYPQTINKGDKKTITFTIKDFSTWIPVDSLFIRVNDDGNGNTNQPVCKECDNPDPSGAFINIDLSDIAWADSYRKCVGDEVLFYSKKQTGTNVSYKWTKPDGTSLATTQNTNIKPLNINHGGIYTFTASNVNDSKLTIEKKLPYLSVAPNTLYWREDAQDRNWNNIRNWSTSTNVKDSLWAVPAPCTTVHLIAGANTYPALDTVNTNIKLYGIPEVNEIVYHFGAETAYPQNLIYNKAYVQYNFGYYSGSEADGSKPSLNTETSTKAPILDRNRWYILAAPLKSVASGDFTFAGYPLTWQSKYDATVTSNKFKTPFATNDENIEDNYNAIAIKVAGKDNKTGYSQKILNGLNGVLEIPFFENKNMAQFHPGHSYNKVRGISSFYYFDMNTLQQVYNLVGSMKRGQEAYRFVYENTTNTIDKIMVNGKNVEGYQISLTGTSVIVGNPFMATIDAKKFYDVNKDVISGTAYQIYDGKSWQAINYSGSTIAPLQAFLVTLKSNSATLLFPLEGDNALTGTSATAQVKISPVDDMNALFVKAVDTNNEQTPYAVLSSDKEKFPKTRKLIEIDNNSTTEVFFIDKDNKLGNVFDNYQQGMQKIGLAVRSSNTNDITTLDFENVTDFAYTNDVRPVLIDKLTGVGQDLMNKNTYEFKQQQIAKEQDYIDYNRFEVRFWDKNEDFNDEEDIKVIYSNGNLEVSAINQFNIIEVYDILGRAVYNSGKLSKGTVFFNQNVLLPNGTYVVKVTTQNGKSISKKVMSN